MIMNETPLRASWLAAIARAFADAPVYAVGGAVRNTLMGLPVSDVDLCGPVRPDDVVRRCGGTEIHARLRAAQFGTVELHIGGHMAEYTTFRRDSYRGGHQPFAVSFADTVEEDALRRDFSVNALYSPLSDPDTVMDPVGGLEHLSARILHTVTDDPDQVLKDDGLRILRAARFQAELGFAPTDAVLHSAKKYADLLDTIVAERKRDELTRPADVGHEIPDPCPYRAACIGGTGDARKSRRVAEAFRQFADDRFYRDGQCGAAWNRREMRAAVCFADAGCVYGAHACAAVQ